MGQLAKVWNAVLRGTSTRLSHTYTGNTLTNTSYIVTVSAVVDGSGGRMGVGREIQLSLTPARARYLAQSLLERADQTEELNSERGYLADQ